jgi:hypothetical protein
MGAGLVTASLLYWLIARIPVVEGRFWQPLRVSTRKTRGALFGGAVALSLSLSIALLVLLVQNNEPTSTNSYYQQLVAENATYLSFYALCILGAYFPLASLEGTKFAAVWISAYYLVAWIQCISLVTVIFSIMSVYGSIPFGDEPCLKAQLGPLLINNPIFYSVLFLAIGGASGIFITGIHVLKVTSKACQLRSQILIDGPQQQPSWSLVSRWAADTEWNFIITTPVALFEIPLGMSVMVLLRFRFKPSRRTTPTKIEIYNKLSRDAETLLSKISNSAWILAVISVPLLWLEAAYILRLRNAMRSIAGPNWIEDQLGFGQILALLLWMPVVVGFTLTLSRLLYLKRGGVWPCITY